MWRADSRSTWITPAYAGKSDDTHSVPLKYQDHPRLCGEKAILSCVQRSKYGSPPPMRGKVNFHFFFLRIFRITPAYAGKSRIFVNIRSI